MTPEQAQALRAPFEPAQIGKLPKPTKSDNPRGKCNECGGFHGLPAVHLDYVGHAAITDRLLKVDPEWSWEPMAVGPNGEPLLTNGGLWIRLTVCGVTRPGFGDESNGKGMKEVIGDALRNGAMRFGVGLDLWSKQRLLDDYQDRTPSVEVIDAAEMKRMFALATDKGIPTDEAKRIIYELGGVTSSKQLPKDRYDDVLSAFNAWVAPNALEQAVIDELDGVPFGEPANV